MSDETKYDNVSQMISLMWMGEYCQLIGVDMDELLEAADNYLSHDDYLCKGDLLDGLSTNPLFWDHYEVLRRTTVQSEDRGSFFSCSC